MRTPDEELRFRISFREKIASIRPADSLSAHSKSNIYGDNAWDYYHIYIYKLALGECVPSLLYNMIDMSEQAMAHLSTRNLKRLEAILLAKALLDEDLTGTAEKILALAPDESDPSISPLYWGISCLLLGKNIKPIAPWIEKNEAKRNTLELVGTLNSMESLLSGDEDALVMSVDKLLLMQHKEANSKRNHAYNQPAAFLGIAPYLITKVAKQLGMGVESKLTENIKPLKIGLSSPADFPEIPKTFQMKCQVNYLTGKTDINGQVLV